MFNVQNLNAWFIISSSFLSEKKKSVELCLLNCSVCGLSQGSFSDLHFLVSGFIGKKCLMELMVIVPLKLGL